MRTLVLGDVHGSYKALVQVLKRAKFNYEHDELICLGDVADGWPDTDKCFEELIKMKRLIFIVGNHDEWLFEWLKYGNRKIEWATQGGDATYMSYIRHKRDAHILMKRHEHVIATGHYYYIDKRNNLYVHGGFNWKVPLEDNTAQDFMWDRHAFEVACMWEAFKLTHPTDKPDYFKDYNEVFVGHTATNRYMGFRTKSSNTPLHVANMWNMDQGAGWAGKLSLMDVDTKEYWQSDNCHLLYPEEAKIKGIKL